MPRLTLGRTMPDTPRPPATPATRRRILFLAEAVTLAHVARPRVLAESLDPARYEVHLAAAATFDTALQGLRGQRWPLVSISPGRFIEALAAGRPIYDAATLEAYVAADLALLDRVRPDLVVGDFRLSLAVSAPLRGVPYAALTNAHWSPYLRLPRWPVPDLPLVRLVGEPIARALFNQVRPAVFWLHGRALNRVRRRHGLPPLGDLRHAYTWGNETLYLDVPELVPTDPLPGNHRFIGPILWEPPQAAPPWWDQVPAARPCVYLSLGSSDPARLLPALIEALATLPISLLVATAGRANLGRVPAHVFAADYLPGSAAARRAVLTICNGGSGTVYQSLGEGTPVLGIATNLDQHLTMALVSAAGAGALMRSEQVSTGGLCRLVAAMLAEPRWGAAAAQVAGWFKGRSAVAGFREFVEHTL